MDNHTFKNKLLDAGLEKEDFSKLTNISTSTIAGWTTKRNGEAQVFPAWVEPYLDLYIENKKNKICIKTIINELKTGAND